MPVGLLSFSLCCGVLLAVGCLFRGNDLSTEGRERQLRNFEKLLSEGDPHDGDAPENAETQVPERHPEAEEDQPDHIGQRGDCPAAVSDILPERAEGQGRELEALFSVGDPDDAEAPEDPGEHPAKAADKAAENEP